MPNNLYLQVSKSLSLSCVLLALGGWGCGGSSTSEPPPEYPPIEAPPANAHVTEPAAELVAPPPPPPAVTIVAATATPIEGDTPGLRITSPRMNQTVRRGDVSLRLRLSNWPLAPAPGPHVHLIVDNEPYIALRDVSSPINLNETYREAFGRDLAEGTHVVRMFPSRGHHESVKQDGAFAMTVFHFRSRSEDFEFDPEAPLLTYSRPKGCNVLGERVLIDFYISGVDGLAADGTRVRYTLGNVTGEITEWAPHYAENLPRGEHTLQLELLGPDGTALPGPFNSTSRVFQVQASCAPPAPAPEEPAAEATAP